MAKGDTKNRIKRIQSHLGVPADGVIGPITLTALENILFDAQQREAATGHFSLTASQKGLKQIVKHEISSVAYYKKFLWHQISVSKPEL
jgi:lysozyme family protein